jgi:Flp pilus assembly protein TadG
MRGIGARDERGDHGAAAVEFALVLPILVLLVGGIIDFGFAFNAQVSLTHAAREGVRVEAIGTGDGAQTAEDAFFAPAVINGSVTASVTQDCDSHDAAQVTIEADYGFFFLSIIPFFPDELTLQGQAVMRCGG